MLFGIWYVQGRHDFGRSRIRQEPPRLGETQVPHVVGTERWTGIGRDEQLYGPWAFHLAAANDLREERSPTGEFLWTLDVICSHRGHLLYSVAAFIAASRLQVRSKWDPCPDPMFIRESST